MIEKHALDALMREHESEKYYVIEFANGESFVGRILRRPHIAGTSKHYSLINSFRRITIFSWDNSIVRFQEV